MRLLLVCVSAIALGACGAADPTATATDSQTTDTAALQETTNVETVATTDQPQKEEDCDGVGQVAPAHLVVHGRYSDERFLDMMSAHHEMAVRNSQLALSRVQHPELRAFAQNTITSQSAEIDEMRSIKKDEFGTSHVPLEMNPHAMENSGSMPPDELAKQPNLDLAYLDSMMPHHGGALQMANVARMRSKNPRIVRLARAIIDAQAMEIGEMIAWRQQWYPGAL